MNSRLLLPASFGITLAIIFYQDIAKCKEAPWPPRIIGAGIVFGLLDLLSLATDELANVLAIGVTLAMLIATLTPAKEQTSQTRNYSFRPVCGPHPCATAQPASYQSLDQGPANPGTIQV